MQALSAHEPGVFDGALLPRLPKVRGKLSANAPLAQASWFGVGGPAEVLFRPADSDDLADFLKDCPADVPITPIGVASNLIIRDGGIRGVVVKLGGPLFSFVRVEGNEIAVGAAALDLAVAQAAAAHGLSGLEFLSGIPGTIGGGLRMNSGAYGGELKDALIEATLVTRTGDIRTLTPAELGLSYRHSDVPMDWIFIACRVRGAPADKNEIAARMTGIRESRTATQPIRAKTGGSTFANPDPGHSDGRKAWQLIDAAGCRGFAVGDAEMSELHCNFMINRGKASAQDLEALGEEVRGRVAAQHGVMLEWEIKRIGIPGRG